MLVLDTDHLVEYQKGTSPESRRRGLALMTDISVDRTNEKTGA